METLERIFQPEVIQKDYSKVAWIYNLWSLLTESKAAEKVLEYADIKDNENILEVAVGTGVLFEKIVLQNKNGLNEGIDISPSMLEKAKLRLLNKNLKNYNLKPGSAYKLEYPDNYFELLVNNYMLDLLPEKDFQKILREFYRVLKPGGKVVISSMASGNNWNNKIWLVISKNFPRLMTNCRPIDIKNYVTKSGFKILDSIYLTQFTLPSEVIKAVK